ncbi:MAG: hypothetical protein B7Z37_16990 [Verrucomicrobia bacterium 12-59-8]|nr:MAG: hypothetical protein B7Z37_16990 [Verrucomicrobia bacterium 12-59-8]
MAKSPKETNSSDSSPTSERTLADAHRDIEFGNNYRLEYIKHLISIATGVFVFSVTFMKDFVGKPTTEATAKLALPVGWLFMVVSILAGILHMRYWACYYTSWGTKWTKPKAKEWRAVINKRRKVAESVQIYGFIAGLSLLLFFTTWNLYSTGLNKATIKFQSDSDYDKLGTPLPKVEIK